MSFKLSGIEAQELFKRKGWKWPANGIWAEVRIRKSKHSESQQGYYWMWLHRWGKELGLTAGDVERSLHTAVLCEAYGTKGHIRVFDQIVPVPNQRSSDASVDEYSTLIEVLIQMAGEHGFHVEQPRYTS